MVIKLPISFVRDRYFSPRQKQSLFIQRSSPFEDLVIRCVRYAFSNVPAKIGRVFFSKEVALLFLRFRLLRHGYFECPVYWKEHHEVSRPNVPFVVDLVSSQARQKSFKGVWVIKDPQEKPDIVIYYAHGNIPKCSSFPVDS